MSVFIFRHLRRNAVVYVALLFALSGTSYGATNALLLPRNSVGTQRVINTSLRRIDVSSGQLPRGGRAARSSAGKTTQADMPELDLTPLSTAYGSRQHTFADLYMPASKEMAKVVLYLPTGYKVDLAKPPGAHIGSAVAFDSNGVGTLAQIVVDDPASHTADACAPGLHQAVWLLNVANPSKLPVIPILVDTTSGTEAGLGGVKAQFCLPPSSSGTERVRLLSLDLGMLTNPSTAGSYTWRAYVTPYAAGAPNDAGTFELRATLPLPIRLTLKGGYNKRSHTALLTGRLVAPAYRHATPGVYLDLYQRRSAQHWGFVRYIRLDRHGAFAIKRKLRKTATFFVETANWDDCASGPTAPAGCVGDTLANIDSPTARVRVR